MTELNDQMLLSRYLRGADDAFRQLLDRHAGLVFGTAMRITGDRGAAEEVSQDVFVMLAKKARALATHPSVAGWLHRTSHNVARHAKRKQLRQDKRIARLSERTDLPTAAPATDAMAGIDEAISRLPRLDREALLLRFFEDLDYGEIARRLNLGEPAARKRVSRALKRLQDTLGPDRAAATASGALVIAAPAALTGSIATTIPTAGALTTAATATATSFLTTMTTNTAIKVSLVAIAGGVLIFTNVQSAMKNKALASELNSVKSELDSLRGSEGSAGEKKAGAEDDLGSSTSGKDRAHTINAKVAALTSDLEQERAKREAAEKKAQALEAELATFDEEVVIAYGKIAEIGRDFSSLFSEARFLSEMEKAGRLGEEDIKRRLAQFYQKAASMGGLSKQIIEMEGDPKEGSEFFSATYADMFGLEDAQRSQLRDIFERHITEAKNRELTLAQISSVVNDDTLEDFEQEAERRINDRQAYFRDVRAELRAVIPEDRQADFDTWVERDGIGFTNLTLRGTPLQFSLGGNQEKDNQADPPAGTGTEGSPE